jgi:type I restriction enzyme S subunit
MKVVPLGSVAMIISGQSPIGSSYNRVGDGMPFYQGKKLFGSRFIKKAETWTTAPAKIAKPGDILMSVRAPVGPVNFTDFQLCIGRGLAAIRTSDALDRDYLFYYLKFNEHLITGSEGAVFSSINKKEIESLGIPLPAIEEQKHIVKILDAAFFKVDQAIKLLDDNIHNAHTLFDAELKTMFEYRALTWNRAKLIDLTLKIGSGATPKGGRNSYQEEGISLVRSLNVYDRGFRYRNLAHLNKMQANKLANVELQSGDVLLNITGASVARCCVVVDNCLPGRVNQHVSILRPKFDLIDPLFLHYLLISKPYKDKLLGIGNAAGSTRQAITKKQLQDFEIYYPDNKDIQLAIVKRLESTLKNSEKIKELYRQKIENLYDLKRTLLTKAFKGEL